MILVTGATGNVGGEVVAAALAAGAPVRALPAQRLEILGTALGRSLRLIPQTDEEARQEMLAGMPAEYVDAFFQFYPGGTLDEATVLPTVTEVTGRPAGTFKEWVTAHAGRFG